MSSIQLRGDKDRVVKNVQKRLDEFDQSYKAYEATENKLNACAAENVQLANIPDHEARYQHLLSEVKKATDNLKHAAQGVREKTNHKHIHKYFEPWESILTGNKQYRCISLEFKQPLEQLHDTAKRILGFDYDSRITQARNASQTNAQQAQAAIELFRREEESAREYSLIDQTFPSCSDRLNRENPAEYLRQSTLYQNKLLEKKDAAAVLAFGKSWIKSLPKEATWEQVENMSFLILKAAGNTDKPDLTEYRASVEQWLQEHPLPGNPDTSSLSPAQATEPAGRRTYVLGLLYLKDNLDLSPEAFQLYQNCSCLYPDQLAWKAAQAYYYCSKRRITEAEQLLADLPKDDPSVANAQTYLAETQLDCKVEQVYERISNQQLPEADQLIADLPQGDPSVIQVQKVLADTRRTLNTYQKVGQAYDRISHFQWSEAEQLLAELPPEDPSVIEANKILADQWHEWNVSRKVSQAVEHISKCEWTKVEQLLAGLPQNHPLVMQAQKMLADHQHEWNVSQKVSQAVEHISKCEWTEVEQLLAGLPQDHPLVMQAQKMLGDHQHAWNVTRKVEQVVKHISKLQWLEAERLLAELPQDDNLVIETKEKFAHKLRERILWSGFDLGTLAFFRLAPSSFRETLTFDAAQTGIQLLSYEAARRIWTSLLLRTSQPSFDVPLRTGLMMVGDVVDCVFRNTSSLKRFQGIENFTSSASRAFNTGWTLYSNPDQHSTLSYMNLGNSLISTIQAFDEMRGMHRSAPTQAIFSTLQKVASDVFAASTITSQADLLPLFRARTHSLARQIGLNTLAALTVSAAPQETQEDSKEGWYLPVIGIGSIAIYRFCFDYPYLWASSVMKEAEWCFSQEKYVEAKQTLIESKKSYWVKRASPAVQAYADYMIWLIDNPRFLENPAAYKEFLKLLNFALVTLHESSYYKGVRNNLLLKKAEVAIRIQNAAMLSEVVKERPADQIIKHSFNYLLIRAFDLVLIDAAQALTFLKVMGPSFPSRLHPITDSLHRLISTALQDWSMLNLLSLMVKPPSPKKVEQWNDAFQKLQSFFSENVGNTEIYQELQAYKLMISCGQGDTEQTKALFKQADGEVQERFSQLLILFTRLLRKAGTPKEVINLLKKVNFDSYNDNELIQSYGHFFSLLYSTPLEGNAALEQIQALEKLLGGLKEKYEEQRIFFSACRVVLYLDAGESAKAKDLLEKANSKVSTEVASLLFERFLLRLSEEKYQEAKDVLNREMPDEFYDKLCEFLFIYLVDHGEQLRQTTTLRNATVTLQHFKEFFSARDAGRIQSYVDFLGILENLQENREIATHQKARQSLETVFSQLESIHCSIPKSLHGGMIDILSKIALLARAAGQLRTALEAYESIKQLGVKDKHLDQSIRKLKEQLVSR